MKIQIFFPEISDGMINILFHRENTASIIIICVAPPPTGLYFMWNNAIYLPGASIPISGIGDQPNTRTDPGSTVVCVTTNVNTACCRGSDGGNVGEWFYPDGTMVPRPSGTVMNFDRVGYTQHVRLARAVSTGTAPLGMYRCDVPDPSTGATVSASIDIVDTPGK